MISKTQQRQVLNGKKMRKRVIVIVDAFGVWMSKYLTKKLDETITIAKMRRVVDVKCQCWRRHIIYVYKINKYIYKIYIKPKRQFTPSFGLFFVPECHKDSDNL